MKSIYIILTIFCWGLVGSCTKEDSNSIRVSGTVTNKVTGKGIAGASVYLFHGVVPVILLSNAVYETVAETKTNADGYYELSTKAESKGFYKVGSTDSNYYSPLNYKADTALIKGKSNIKNYSFYPLKVAAIKLRILRHDKAWLAVNVYESDCCRIGFNRDIYNKDVPVQDVDSTIYAKFPGGIDYKIYATLYDKIIQPNGTVTFTNPISFNTSFYLSATADTTYSMISIQ